MRNKKTLALLTLLLSILLNACDNSGEALRLGTNVWPGYEPLYLAREKNYLESEKVHLVEYSSASQVLQSYRNGLIDAAAVTLDEAMLLLETGEKPKIILVTDISNGADVIIGNKQLQSLKDIKGKRIGVEGTALGAYLIFRALESANIDKDSVTIIQKSVDEHEKAFLNGEVDAIVTFEPVKSKLLAAGGVQLFDSSALQSEIVDVLLVRQSFLQQNNDTVKHLIRGWYRALDEFRQHPMTSAALLGKRMQLNTKQTLAAYEGLQLPDQQLSQYLLYGKPIPPLRAIAENMKKLMLENKLLTRNIELSTLFLPAALIPYSSQEKDRD